MLRKLTALSILVLSMHLTAPVLAADCCQTSGSPGCNSGGIEACVCAQDPFCCETEWDGLCVDEVEEFDCGLCSAGNGDCCSANGSPGCQDFGVQSCVCAQDSFCCENQWDDICVEEVDSVGCGQCGGGSFCGDGACDNDESCGNCPQDCGSCGGSGDCCLPNGTPGCDDGAISACVCAADSYCCETEWDDICVDEVESEACGVCEGDGPDCGNGECEAGEDCENCPDDCGPCGGTGSCCEVQDTEGCDDPTIQACVCDQDSFCCEIEWDEICVNEVTSLQCGQCDGGPACGDGECQGGENCEVCPADCGECSGAGDCCEPLETPGCGDAGVQACVCALDEYCCETKWDDICADEVEGEGCGSCAPCAADCAGKACGDDGCGGTCGSCPQGESCQNGECVGGACQPDCAGQQCGDDGCGGTCGSCPQGQNCQNGKCIGGCQPECAGMQCGDDGCGGSCGKCPPGLFCNDGHCQQECEPECMGKKCGDDGCGGTCGACPPGFFCSADGHCNAQCQPDCAGMQCGDDGCGGTCGSCPPNQTCTNGHCSSSCLPNCGGKQCGDDGCGGTCGSCPPSQFCNLQGHCIADCTPDCAGKMCGSDGCGGACGNCGFSEQCTAGQCVADCVASCLGQECGDNGCGGSCGICGQDMTCSPEGVCLTCLPDCDGKECGDDGCDGSCGDCGSKDECHPEQGICYGPGADVVWNVGPGGDAWADDGAVFGEECEEGQRRVYGKCVAIDEADAGDVDSSCRIGGDGSPADAILLLILMAGLLVRRIGSTPPVSRGSSLSNRWQWQGGTTSHTRRYGEEEQRSQCYRGPAKLGV